MNAESARQCLTGMGLRPDRVRRVAELVEADRMGEARQQLRSLRCDLVEELHLCQRRVDRLDWLIRETERADREKESGRKEER